jgi:hypothetical protein
LDGKDYIFVVRQVEGIEKLEDWLSVNWPDCGIIRIPYMTGGAMFTAMVGVALLPDEDELLIVDLADILFENCPDDPCAQISDTIGVVVPCFLDDDPCYSYLRFDAGKVVEAAEKRVISDHASAGVYIFRNRSLYLSAAAYSIAHADKMMFKGIQFVCPMVNGVLAAGFEVVAPLVGPVTPVGKMFH